MASTPVAPAAPSTSPSPASSTPAPASPTPAPVSTPETAAPATGASAPAVAAKPEPKQADFPGDIVGFLNAHREWEESDETPATEQPAAETKPAEAETKIEEKTEETPVDETKPWAPEPEEVLTPEALNSWLDKSPSLKQAMEESPELKNAMFAMARTNAKAAPLLEIFPNAESAKFASETANKFVGLRTGFQRAVDDPESFPEAFGQFAEEFMQRDNAGNPVTDSEGYPVFDEDFHLLTNHIVDAYHDTEIADLEAQIKAGKFASEEAKENAEMALSALQFVKTLKDGEGASAKPDLSGLSPELRDYYEQKEREIEEREAKLGAKTTAQGKEVAKQARQEYETGVRKKIGGAVGKRLENYMAEKEKAGIYIPSYVLSTKDPTTGISVFAKTIFDAFQKAVSGDASTREQLARLEMAKASPEAETQWLNKVLELVDTHVPTIVDRELREIQKKEIADRSKRPSRERAAEREPRGGSAPRQQVFNEAGAIKAAEEFVDKNYPDISRVDRMAKVLVKRRELMGQ